MDLREESRWEDRIYQIERSDPIVGGEFGINNVQAKQLANRTQYLLWYFLLFHNADGRHFLKGTDLDAGSRIPENRFAFAKDTAAVHSGIEALRARYDAVLQAIEDLSLGNEAPATAMLRAMTLVWKYGGYGMDFCLFTPDFNFMENDDIVRRVYRAANGDDSIDVTNMDSLVKGGSYILSFAGNRMPPRLVTVKEILEEDRVLLTEEMDFNLQGSPTEEGPDDAYLSSANWAVGGAEAHVSEDSMMITRTLTALNDFAYGILDIGCEGSSPGFTVQTRHVSYDSDGSAIYGEWTSAEVYGHRVSGETAVDSWRFEAGSDVQVLITSQASGTVDYMCVYPDPTAREPKFVRTPTVSGMFLVERYGAMYLDPFEKLVITLDTDQDLSEGAVTVELNDIDLENPVADVSSEVLTALVAKGYSLVPGTTYYWRARYYAESGKASMWTPLASFTYEL